jgi:hypothetical protein
MTDDPWKTLPPSPSSDLLSARRVDPQVPFSFFWARGADRKCLLLLRHKAQSKPNVRLPRLKGIDIAVTNGETKDTAILALRLQDSSQRDLFYRLCIDIVASASSAVSEGEAVAATLARTWRWHHLLRGGSDQRLSEEEQKGLIGELTVLRRLLQRLSACDAVQSWRGPLGAPKDFEIGRVAVESKARRGAAVPYVAISSEHQLDTTGVDRLLLVVHEVDQVPADSPEGYTVTEVARSLSQVLVDADPASGASFESLLMSAGFRWEDDYSDAKWLVGRELFYRVASGFPSITPACFAAGVLNVRYSVALHECEPFLIDAHEFEVLGGGEQK